MGRFQRDGKTYLTAKETAEILKCGHARVRQFVAEERLVAVKFPDQRARLITLESVVDLLAARKMLRGMDTNDFALVIVQMERRLRKLEYLAKRRSGIEPADPAGDVPMSLASRLLAEIESLKH